MSFIMGGVGSIAMLVGTLLPILVSENNCSVLQRRNVTEMGY